MVKYVANIAPQDLPRLGKRAKIIIYMENIVVKKGKELKI
jgi:hypothetical protein